MRPGGIGLVAALFASALSAQVRLTGRVVSDTNAAITNAVVTVRAEGDALPRARVTSDPSGAFVLQLSTPGAYLLTAEAVGYYSLLNRPIAAAAGDHEIAITLNPVREFADSVDVTAASGSIALDETSTQETLTGAQMIDIPFPVNHDLKAAMRALPNVVQDNSNSVHLNGGAENQTLYLLDGFNINDPLTGTFNTRLSIEGIQELNVQTGAISAEYGKGSAGVIAVSTRTGDDRIRYSATNFVPGADFNKGLRVGSWNPRFNVSGPIRRSRVWFADSLWGQYNQTVIRELPPGSDTSSSVRYSNFLHVQANLTPTNIAQFGFFASMWNANRVGLGALDPPQTTLGERQRQWFAYAKDQVYFGHGGVAEFGFATNRTFNREIPYGAGIYIYTPYGRFGNYFMNGTQDGSRNQAIANVYLPSFEWAGSHQFKVGVDIDRVGYAQDLSRTGYEWLNVDNAPVRKVIFGGNGQLGKRNVESTQYVQDSWRWRSNVLVELGLRTDWDRLLANWTASPRVGVAWSPSWLQNTKISGGYAISYDETNLELFTRPLDQYPITYYYPPYGNLAAPVVSTFITGRGYRSPRFSTWSAAIDRRFGPNITLRADATRRRGTNGLTYLASSDLTTVSDIVYRLTNARNDSYDAVGLTARQNFRKEYGWMASYTRSSARSNAVVDLSSDTPLLLTANAGRLPWDAPNRFIGWAYLPTFWRDWAIATLFEYRSGFPFSVENSVGQVVGDVNSWRFPTFLELNFHIEKRFTWRGQRWAGRMGYNNITGHNNPNVVNNTADSPQFLTFYGGQMRAFQFRIRWLGKLK